MSPVALADGPLGLEAIHRFYPSRAGAIDDADDLVDPYFDLNELSTNPRNGGSRVKLTTIGNFRSLPESDDNRDAPAGRIGERAWPSLQRGKTITYEGWLQSPTLQALRAYSTQFTRFLGDKNNEGRMVIRPHSDYGTVRTRFDARVIDLEIPEEQTVGPNHPMKPWQRPFTLTLRLSDPRFYSASVIAGTGLGLTARPDGGHLDLTNLGSAPTEFIARIELVDNNVIIERTAPDPRVLTFTDLGAYVGETLDFSSRLRHLNVLSTGTALAGHLDLSVSDWWNEGEYMLLPDDNTIRVRGGTWNAVAFHAFW